jgi:pimeloyl-ACP methyl ester carboxylesterase
MRGVSGVMNDKRAQQKLKMVAFDLPAHGRSFPPTDAMPGEHSLTEDMYIGIIAAVIKKLGLKRPIVCGASMAGEVCLAVAIRNKEVGSGGVIPLQGSDCQ